MPNSPEEFISAYEAALETQDWELVAPLIHENCVATFTEDTFVGKAAVEGAFRKTFELIQDETYKITDIHWIEQNDDYAVLIYIYNWSGVINGEQASGSGRGTSVLINESGSWQVLTEHLGPLGTKPQPINKM